MIRQRARENVGHRVHHYGDADSRTGQPRAQAEYLAVVEQQEKAESVTENPLAGLADAVGELETETQLSRGHVFSRNSARRSGTRGP